MRHFVWIPALAAAGMLGACAGADDASEPGADEASPSAAAEQATVAQDSAALKINPCALVRCRAGTQCEVQDGRATCVPIAKDECSSDKDCRLFSNYCDGCECLALSSGEVNPVCGGQIVACFVDPCRGAEARCVRGQCVLGGAAASF
jgi:hypothetical protein